MSLSFPSEIRIECLLSVSTLFAYASCSSGVRRAYASNKRFVAPSFTELLVCMGAKS